jgi:acyl carrier protein
MAVTTRDRLTAIIVDFADIDWDEVKEDSNIKSILGVDSIDLLELAMIVEKEFDVLLPDCELSDAETVKDFEKVLTKALENR